MKGSTTMDILESKGDENKERGNWDRKIEFLLSLMGYAIGIGNVWRFPYLCYRNGGGAFLVPYLICLLVCGIPLFFMETALGQFSGTGCITVFKLSPLWKGAGFAMVIVNFLVSSYYIIIICYPLYFLSMSFTSELPWSSCGNSWNTENCVSFGVAEGETHDFNSSLLEKGTTVNMSGIKTAADEFFHNRILQISDGIGEPGTVIWQLLICDVIAWLCVYACIIRGIKSVGKVVYFTVTFPYVILLVLFIRGVTLPGAKEGILFYITPQWDQLSNLKVWADAAVQIFFSLGPGWGGIINMSSYNKFHNNSKLDSIIVPIVNCCTSIFAGFVVFSVLGYMSHKTGIPVSTVAAGGPGLAFITYPEAITLLPMSPVWAVLFFSMLFFLGIDSQFVQIECVISGVTDEYPVLQPYKNWVSICACIGMFLLSLSCITEGGMYVLQVLDWYCASISVILICLVEVIIVGWIYGCRKFVRDLEFMIMKPVFIWWRLCWMFITPSILLLIFITTIVNNTPVSYGGQVFPQWAQGVGWGSGVISMACIPSYAIYRIWVTPGSLWKRLVVNLRAQDWHPPIEMFTNDWRKYCKMYPPVWFSLGWSFERVFYIRDSHDSIYKEHDGSQKIEMQ